MDVTIDIGSTAVPRNPFLVQTLIQECRRDLRKGKRSTQDTTPIEKTPLRALQDFHPRTHREWELCNEFFEEIHDRAWAEIATDRFLLLAPKNVTARIRKAELCAMVSSRKKEAVAQLSAATKFQIERADDCIKCGTLFGRLGDFENAAFYRTRAKLLAPDDTALRIAIIHGMINDRDFVGAKQDIDHLLDLTARDDDLLISTITLAGRLKDKKYTLALLKFVSVDGLSVPQRLRLIEATQTLSEHREFLALVLSIDFGEAENVAQLQRVFCVIEGKGLLSQERAMIDRALQLDPANEFFAGALLRNNLPFVRALVGMDAKSPRARKSGRVAPLRRWCYGLFSR